VHLGTVSPRSHRTLRRDFSCRLSRRCCGRCASWILKEGTMNQNQALWEKGDFTRIAASMRRSGEELVERLGITKGLKVLDVGCGDGTTAVPAAKQGAEVLGVDIARNLVDAGNRRARELNLANLRFQHGDVSDLAGLEDKIFDLTLSIFGAMFAPK